MLFLQQDGSGVTFLRVLDLEDRAVSSILSGSGTGCLDIEPWRHTHRIDWLPEDSDHILFTCGRDRALVRTIALPAGQSSDAVFSIAARNTSTAASLVRLDWLPSSGAPPRPPVL